jgi:hypothetical protein
LGFGWSNRNVGVFVVVPWVRGGCEVLGDPLLGCLRQK